METAMNRAAKFDERKFAELMLYIAAKCQEHDRFGGTKLNKILFYSDFLSYLSRGKPITGAVYQKLQYGPAPKHLLPVQEKLISSGDAAKQDVIKVGASYAEKRLIALRRPDLSLFDAEEIAIVDAVIEKLKDATATAVSDGSHEFPSWKLAALKEEIPYCAAYIPRDQPMLSQQDEAWARKVAQAFTDKNFAQA